MNATSIALYVGGHYVKHPGLVSEATRTFEDTQELLYMWKVFVTVKDFGILASLMFFFLALIFFLFFVVSCINQFGAISAWKKRWRNMVSFF